ncbi:GtrA family protein [Kushneria aurantia]|uniref:Bactoprenol-linked glucose translocase n=1 Tax=Kushneria aurantia TaxID=504092 RepID=A0ABV6FYW0_9GAMM|nr:GtrA family protein [Kushneria aurantia]
MQNQFVRYALIGILNTTIHWLTFLLLFALLGSQSLANLAGYLTAATFSFFANARWTFKSEATTPRYIAFVAFMGVLSWGFGWAADAISLHPLLTLIGFSALSLVLGFLFSRFLVFRSRA